MIDQDTVLDCVRRALGHAKGQIPLAAPPELSEPLVRLVHTEIGLPELFAKRATEMGSQVQFVRPEEVGHEVASFLRSLEITRVVAARSALLQRLGVIEALRDSGSVECRIWDEMDPGGAYDCQAGLTDVTYAVAETGSLVIRTHAGNGRALSLVPMIHVAIIEPKNLVPDLLDLFEKLGPDPSALSYTVMISGPSKTADIEMNVVTGVHGPNTVKVFVLH